jgi:hypothetical protein
VVVLYVAPGCEKEVEMIIGDLGKDMRIEAVEPGKEKEQEARGFLQDGF